ncbi:histidine kinase [Acrocarpospora phusangensis]|uniref:histidine kinase n=1 Tax=Acrocarpospora phusangensis TaxID=1070424 RepID=UPI0035A25271
MRRWRSEEAERRRLSAHVAATAERARIARELHDVVTHHATAGRDRSEPSAGLPRKRSFRLGGCARWSMTGSGWRRRSGRWRSPWRRPGVW